MEEGPSLSFHGELGGVSEATEGARRRVGGGSAVLVTKLRRLAITRPRAALQW